MNTRMIPDAKPIMVGETGIQAALRVKKTKDMMEDAEGALDAAMRSRRG
jgi:hypothetical protein